MSMNTSNLYMYAIYRNDRWGKCRSHIGSPSSQRMSTKQPTALRGAMGCCYSFLTFSTVSVNAGPAEGPRKTKTLARGR